MSGTKKDNQSISSFAVFKKLLIYIGRYRLLLVLSAVLAAASVVLQLYAPILFGDAIDGIIGAGKVRFDIVGYYLPRILIVIAAASAATWVMNLINNRMTFCVVRDIRAKAIRKIQTLPLSYLDAHSSGDIISRVIADVDQLSDGLLLGFTQIFSGVITIAATLIFMLQKDVKITLIVVLMTPLSFFAARFIATHSYKMFRKQSQSRGEQTALVNEMIGGQKVVRAFNYENRASLRFAEINEELREYSRKAIFYSSLTNPATRFVNGLIYAVVTLVGALTIIEGGLTVGGLSALLSYANQFMKPFNDISSVITELQNAMACASRVFDLIEEESEPADPDRELVEVEGDVRVEHVDFSYDKSKPLIEDLNLDIKPGMSAAIVGPTGCGKTTFINLLMRFYDADSGKIYVDDQNIYDHSRESLRRHFGMVLQDTWIKHDTVRANIAFGAPEATDEEIIEAAKKAHSWEFIRRLPEGLDTVLTDESLSQGQLQLLCITRVMLCDPPMLILDEATSSIDTRTEIMVQRAFDTMMKGRTSFVVAHRLSTIRNADVILVMRDGRIIEKGNHQSLIEAGGFYKKLYESQFLSAENGR